MNRIIPGLILVASWLLLLFFAPLPLFSFVLLLVGCIGLYEYCMMVRDSLTGVRFSILIPFLLFPLAGSGYGLLENVGLGILMSMFSVIAIALRCYERIPDVQRFLSSAVFGSLYIGFCLAHVVLLRFHTQGVAWLLVLSAITAGSDTGAYYIGRAFGRHKLCAHISPGKTVEGALGGITAGILLAEIISCAVLPVWNFWQICFAAVLLVIIGIVGDLTESVIKRCAGVKDSGTLLAGHGGVLDRIDSLLLTAPVLYYLLHFRILS